MRNFVCALAAGVAFSAVAWAGGDKSSTAFVDPSSLDGGANGFTNGVSSGSSKSSGCTTQIKIKGLTGLNDGDQVICIGSADVKAAALPPGGAGNSVVWTVPVAAGQIKLKSSVAIIDVGGNHCGSTKATAINSDARCYKPDGAYNPQTACGTIPGIWIAAPANTTGLVGLCQGTAVGQRIPPPSSGEICRTGMTIPVGAK